MLDGIEEIGDAHFIFSEVIDYMLQENIKLEQKIVAYKKGDDPTKKNRVKLIMSNN